MHRVGLFASVVILRFVPRLSGSTIWECQSWLVFIVVYCW